MLMRPLSMRVSLVLTIVTMGLLGLGLALVTGEVYRHQTLEMHDQHMVELLKLKTRELLNTNAMRSRDLGLSTQQDTKFQQAMAARDVRILENLLDNQFHQYFVTAEIINLEKLQAFDLDFLLVAESTEGAPMLADGKMPCPTLINQARTRQGASRVQIISEVCVFTDQLYQAVIVPIGGLRPTGYLQIVTNPVQRLADMGSILSVPLKITLASGQALYQSKDWLKPIDMGKSLVSEYNLSSPSSGRLVTLKALNDTRSLEGNLASTRLMIMIAAGVIIFLVGTIALLALRAAVLRPLLALHDQFSLVGKDRSQLGQALTPCGTAEIRELSQDFNTFSVELKGMHQVLERMAFTDALTELPNRSHFHDYLQACAQASHSNRRPFALFVMDLDRFKEVNDTFGHDIGDQLLTTVGARLKGTLRRSEVLMQPDEETASGLDGEIVARMGGDEFAAIVPDVGDTNLALTIAQRFVKAMEQPFVINTQRYNIGISIGVTLYPQHSTDPKVLLRQADIAMYDAKQNKHGCAVFDSARDHHKLQQMTFENDLRKAIESDNLEMHYQPIIDIRSGKVRCAEALVRWRYPDQDFVAADKVIQAAEQSGLILPLTRWVLNRAVEQCMNWHKSGFQMYVSVNISAVNLHEPDFVDYVSSTLHRWEMEPSWLSLELTESAVMSNPNHALEVMSRLDAMGVRISIDDFGTGYSSLAYLKKLPVDEIKIDKSFVIDMKHDSNDAVIVRSTIDLAHNMSMQVVAEGVENEETLQLLSSFGCDKVQGYLFSRPLAYEKLIQWSGNFVWEIKQPPDDTTSDMKRSSVMLLHRPRPG
jgi:diguanylate cyclase